MNVAAVVESLEEIAAMVEPCEAKVQSALLVSIKVLLVDSRVIADRQQLWRLQQLDSRIERRMATLRGL